MNKSVSTVTYTDTAVAVTTAQLNGFFSHWHERPSPETLLQILKGSDYVVLAMEESRLLGYITAISDGVSCAYIPHLEVRKDRRGEGIGSELVRRMLEQLQHLYMIDLICDAELQPFYKRLGFHPYSSMIIRNYERQRCE